jgi:Kef-type K+ transport system membrane component KefB
MFGGTTFQSLFVGMGLSITAIAVQARILHDMQIHNTKIGHIIIGAAIVDDILALVTLSILLGLAESGTFQVIEISFVFFKVAAFFAFTILIGQFIIPRFIRKLDDREAKTFTFALVCALVMAYLAELAGLHLIIGAFLAGQFVRKEIIDQGFYQKINDSFHPDHHFGCNCRKDYRLWGRSLSLWAKILGFCYHWVWYERSWSG